jgi:hypothetical protein
MEQQEFDLNLATLPRTDTAGTIALAAQLLAAMPPRAPKPIKDAAARVQQASKRLQAAWSAVQAGARPNARPFDQAIDRAWGAFFARLDALASFHPGGRVDGAARAAEIKELLFPSGLSFLTLAYTSEWAESEKRLQQMKQLGIEDELSELVGAVFLREVKYHHERYGQVLGMKGPIAEPAELPNVKTPLLALRAALRSYVLKVIGTVDEEDRDSVRSAIAMLAPIEAFRSANQRRSQPPGPVEPIEPVGTPVPPAPPVTEAASGGDGHVAR